MRIRSKHKSLIVRSPHPGSLAQAGTYLLRSLYLLTGVAVASQVLCTSTTLNKRNSNYSVVIFRLPESGLLLF